jgi:hypothetical protein
MALVGRADTAVRRLKVRPDLTRLLALVGRADTAGRRFGGRARSRARRLLALVDARMRRRTRGYGGRSAEGPNGRYSSPWFSWTRSSWRRSRRRSRGCARRRGWWRRPWTDGTVEASAIDERDGAPTVRARIRSSFDKDDRMGFTDHFFTDALSSQWSRWRNRDGASGSRGRARRFDVRRRHVGGPGDGQRAPQAPAIVERGVSRRWRRARPQPPLAWVRATSESTSSYWARVKLRRAWVSAACDSSRSVVVAAPALRAASVTR